MEKTRRRRSPIQNTLRRLQTQAPIIRIRSKSRTCDRFTPITPRPSTGKVIVRKVCWKDREEEKTMKSTTWETTYDRERQSLEEESSGELVYEAGKEGKGEEGNIEELTTICYDIFLKALQEGKPCESFPRLPLTAPPSINQLSEQMAAATVRLRAQIPSKSPPQPL